MEPCQIVSLADVDGSGSIELDEFKVVFGVISAIPFSKHLPLSLQR